VKPAFAETFYWIALANPRDIARRRVLDFGRTSGLSSIMTTDEVLTEFLAFCASDAQLRVEAAAVVHDVLSASHVRVVPQTRSSFLAGSELSRARPDKEYSPTGPLYGDLSLTDCISMQATRREGLSDALTNDRHFQQEGFRALFRES
jgi:predicted nucleic acid-binding protein